MNNTIKMLFVFLCVIVAALCILPVMSTYLSDSESGEIVVRGYNLPEFSAWAVVPLLSPLLLPVIVFSAQTKAIKEAELLLLSVGSMVCYVYSFNAARAWIDSLGGSPTRYYFDVLLIPVSFVLLLIFLKVTDLIPLIKTTKIYSHYFSL